MDVNRRPRGARPGLVAVGPHRVRHRPWIERTAAGQLEPEGLGALDDAGEGRRDRRGVIAQQPRDLGREQLEAGTRHADRGEGVRVVRRLVAVEEPRQVRLEAVAEAGERIIGRDARQVVAEGVERRAAQGIAGESRSGVEADELGVWREDSLPRGASRRNTPR